ncbi:MAG: ATP-binding protein [Chthoniobacteraceae bacterium]
MPLKDIPIRRKLMVIIMLTAFVALLLMRLIFFTYEFLTFRQATLKQLSTVGKVIAANSTAALAFDNQDDAQEILAALKADQNVVAAALYDKSGQLFAKYPADVPGSLLPVAPESAGYHYRKLSLIGFQPVEQAGRNLGTLYLRVDTGLIMRQWFWNSVGIAIVAIGITFIVAYLISKALQKQISQPILSLADTARTISGHRDFSIRAKKMSNDELGLLTDAFNQMLAEIQAQDKAIRIDIAKRKEAEAEVNKLNAELEQRVAKRTAELESANKELEAFSYSISHDLRAPLRAVDGFSQAVMEDYGEQLPEQGRHYLQTIRDGAQRMGMLIDDLLAFSRLSRQPVNKQEVNVAKLVRDVLEELEPQREGREIDLRVGDLPEYKGDAALLKQVWINLLSNALKYSRDSKPAVIEVGCNVEQGENVYFVRDNGAGFDMQYANKLFGVFQRLHRADEFEGTGVGLAIVQRIIHRHGGRIWADAAPGRGATFYFT